MVDLKVELGELGASDEGTGSNGRAGLKAIDTVVRPQGKPPRPEETRDGASPQQKP